ncbi:MAG TPA: rRNA small subunit methyltransferase B, partial [Micromonospora sp.]
MGPGRPGRHRGAVRVRPPSTGERRSPGGRPSRPGRPPVDRPRRAAYEAVAAVHRDDAYANLVLPVILRD